MLLFLDFDGVLHPALGSRASEFCRRPQLEAVLRGAPGVRIVVSSTWREVFGLAELRSRFSADIAARIVGATPVLPGRSRHAEIMDYLQRHARHDTQWVALDDTPEAFPRGCPYLIRCDPRSGLTEEVARELARRLAEMEASASPLVLPVVDAAVSEGPAIGRALVIHLRETFRLNWRGAHGVAHWARVRVNGLALAARNGANRKVVELFAFVHDCERRDEWSDPLHGARAAHRLPRLLPFLPPLLAEEIELLADACHGHTSGRSHPDVTVATCWDADRLDLGRVGIEPHPDYLCTAEARQPETIAAAHARALAWLEIRGRRR